MKTFTDNEIAGMKTRLRDMVHFFIANDGSAIAVDGDVGVALEGCRFYRRQHYMGHYGRPYVIASKSHGRRRPPERALLARLVSGARAGQIVKHINGNVADCRRANIQLIDIRNR